MTNKKRALSVVLTILVLAAAAVGIGYAVRRTTSGGTVMVIPADTLNYGWYYGSASEAVDGYMATDATQNVYVTDSESVAKVHVKEGDLVKKGDLLLTYDTEQAAIALAQRELELDQLRLGQNVAERNLETLRKISPIAEGGYDPVEPEEPEEPEEPDTTAEVYEVLDKTAVPFNIGQSGEEGEDLLGTMAYPYRYLVYSDREITVKQAFIQSLIEKAKKEGKKTYYITLEAHEENDPEKKISSDGRDYVLVDVLKLEAVTGDMVLDYTAEEPVLQEKNKPTPTPTETPTPTPTETATPTPEPEDPDPTPTPGGEEAPQEQTGGEDSNETNPTSDSASENTPAEGSDGEEAGGENGSAEGTTTASIAWPFRVIHAYAPKTLLMWSGHWLEEEETNFTIAGGPRLISSDAQYTNEELKVAIQEEENTLRDLQLDIREAELKLRLEQKAVEEGAAYAKMDGVVRKVGDPQKPPVDGSAFLQVTGSSGLYVQGELSETMLDKVQEGDMVTVQSWQTGMVYDAEITEISPYASRDYFYGYYGTNASASSYPFLACIADPTAELNPDESLQITFQTEETLEEEMPDADTLYLYKAFVLEENGKKYVYKRGADGLLTKEEITVGDLSGQGWRIKSGVSMQDYLAFPYGKDVQEGAKTREGTLEELYAE